MKIVSVILINTRTYSHVISDTTSNSITIAHVTALTRRLRGRCFSYSNHRETNKSGNQSQGIHSSHFFL